MKRNLFKLMLLLAFIPLLSCRDEVDVDGLLSFPPAIKESYPFDNGQVVIGGFDVRIIFADGQNSPLRHASVSIQDAAGTELYAISEDLSGTLDSINIDGSEFDANLLGAGDYKMMVTAEDSKGQSKTYDIDFSIITSLYPANNDAMYLAGEFNSWGALEMELVGAYTWQALNVNLNGGKFKFKNTTDWTDQDWGDADCDKVMAVTTGGGPDTNCGYTGPVNITFNDNTLAYTITPAVTYAANLSGLYAFGNFNNFQGPPTYKFTLKSDHVWELAEIRLKAGDYFKFFETANLSGKNYGGSGLTGTAVQFGSNFVLAGGTTDAFYKITFNDQTLAYAINLVRMPYPETLNMVGSIVGWNNAAALPMKKLSAGVFEIYYQFGAADEFKFLPTLGSWDGDWGRDGANAGKIIQDGEQNLTPPNGAGFYRVTVDFTTMSYSVVKTDWGIIGSATPGGWDNDTNMTFVSDNKWSIDITLAGGEFKFRANDAWDINFGLGATALSLSPGSSTNLPSPGPGNYHIEMILDPVGGYRYTITPN